MLGRCTWHMTMLGGIALGTLGCCTAAIAAVRQCHQVIVATGGHPQSELEARKVAMAQWTAAARIHGDGFTRWLLADKRALTCSRTAGGGYLCSAAGAPCIISQTPGIPSPRAPAPVPSKKGVDA